MKKVIISLSKKQIDAHFHPKLSQLNTNLTPAISFSFNQDVPNQKQTDFNINLG